MWELEKINNYVQNSLSVKRFNHVLGVVETAEMLAKMHGADIKESRLVALIHDVAKEQDIEEARLELESRNENDYLLHSYKVWHAPLGSFLAKEKFGITNQTILDAIKYHPTGRPNMSLVEKILFVADYTEPNRKFEGAIKVRDLWDNLDTAVTEILRQKVEKITQLGLPMHPDTLTAYDYYKT